MVERNISSAVILCSNDEDGLFACPLCFSPLEIYDNERLFAYCPHCNDAAYDVDTGKLLYILT